MVITRYAHVHLAVLGLNGAICADYGGYLQVLRYVKAAAKAVIPRDFWGSDRNFNVVMTCALYSRDSCTLLSFVEDDGTFSLIGVEKIIAGRRYETVTLHQVLQGFAIADCDWLSPTGGKSARQDRRSSVSDSLKRSELLYEFLYWFFDSFVIPLLKV